MVALVEIGERRQIDETVASKNDDAIRSMGGEDVLRRANLMHQRFACDNSVLEFELGVRRGGTSTSATGPAAAGASHASNCAPK